MSNRTTLHEELIRILGNNNVYYQPPESIKMNYPCIVYTRNDIKDLYADNDKYLQNHQYKITLIDKNPDSLVMYSLSKFKNSKFVNHFCTEGLNHYIFTIYY